MRVPGRRLVAAAAVAAAAAAAVPVLAASPAAAATGHVGLVVRFADGNTRTACVTSGGNGLAELGKAFSVTVGQSGPYAGFVLQINSTPSSAHPDNTHYWSYWHSPGDGSWAYSGSGAGSDTPQAGTVEGWSYVNGQSSAPPPPAASYGSVCGSVPAPKPSSTRPSPKPSSSRRTAQPTSSPSSPKPSAPHATRSADAAPVRPSLTSASSSSSVPAHVSTTPVAHPPASTSTARASASRPSGDAHPTSSSVVTAPTRSGHGPASLSALAGVRPADPPKTRSAAGFPAWGTALALLVVVALGGGAWLSTRHRPE